MKRNEAKAKVGVDGKSYRINLSELYTITFTKPHGAFKKGDTSNVSLPLALKFVKLGVATATSEIKEAAKKVGIESYMEAEK